MVTVKHQYTFLLVKASYTHWTRAAVEVSKHKVQEKEGPGITGYISQICNKSMWKPSAIDDLRALEIKDHQLQYISKVLFPQKKKNNLAQLVGKC